jgi:formyl-CoA transferase
VRSLAEALVDEQTAINGMVIECDGAVERVRVVGSPIHLEDAPVTIRFPPAQLGQHTDEVLAETAALPVKAAS